MLILRQAIISNIVSRRLFIALSQKFFESTTTGNIIGCISLIIGAASLIYSIKSFNQAKLAAAEAKDASDKIDKIKNGEVLGKQIDDEFKTVKEIPDIVDQVKGYMKIISRIKENPYLESKKEPLDSVYNALEKLISDYSSVSDFTLRGNKTAITKARIDENPSVMVEAEGLINACIDILYNRG